VNKKISGGRQRRKPKLTAQRRRGWEKREARQWTGSGPNPMRTPKGYQSMRETDPSKRVPLTDWLRDRNG
jgi:hypothetical protein